MTEQKGFKNAHSAHKRRKIKAKKKPPAVDKPLEDTTQKSSYKLKAKFSDQHVRWTGYLTKTNDSRLRKLLAEQRIQSLTRCVNDAVAQYLQDEFGLKQDETT